MERLPDDGNRGESASLVRVGTTVAALTAAGDLVFFQPDGDAWRQVAAYPVSDGPTWTHPVLTGDRLLIKTPTTLRLFRY